MKIDVDALHDIKYDEQLMIGLIEKDKMLRTTFKNDFTLSFNVMLALAKENTLNQATKHLLEAIFKDIVLVNESLIHKYKLLSKSHCVDSVKPISSKESGPSNNTYIPRRYGKKQIEADIKKQNGKATSLQLAMLSINDLKNITYNLMVRGRNDKYRKTNLLTDVDCRRISAAVRTLNNQLRDILRQR